MLRNMLLLYLLVAVAGAVNLQAEERLSGQNAYHVGGWIGPYIGPAGSREAQDAVDRHVHMLGKTGSMALRCEYEIVENGVKFYANVNLWYRNVGATQRELAAVSSVHPLALLGERAFESCPDRATASAHAHQSLERFRKIAAGMDPDAPGPAPPIAIDPEKPVICAYVDTQSGSFEFYNNCDFDVNYSYCRSLLSMSRSRCQGNGQTYFAKSKARFHLKIPHTGTASAVACRHPYQPGTRVVEDHGFRKTKQVCEPPRSR